MVGVLVLAVADFCREHGIVFIADEIQTGGSAVPATGPVSSCLNGGGGRACLSYATNWKQWS